MRTSIRNVVRTFVSPGPAATRPAVSRRAATQPTASLGPASLGRATLALVAIGALSLAACSSADTASDSVSASSSQVSAPSDHEGHGATGATGGAGGTTAANDSATASGGMDHPMDGGPAPAGIAPLSDPTYPVGTAVTIHADHMAGMKGASGTVTGAFATITYAVTFTPTTGGAPVRNHKWVVREEITPRGEFRADQPLPVGTEVTLNAEHMAGMKGATATIDSSTEQTVYMVDLEMDGMTMTNHKWVTEDELSPR